MNRFPNITEFLTSRSSYVDAWEGFFVMAYDVWEAQGGADDPARFLEELRDDGSEMHAITLDNYEESDYHELKTFVYSA